MSLFQYGVIGCALAMDSFAVSVSSSINVKQRYFVHALRLALCFALFQALMPFLGWLLGRGAVDFVREIDHWLAFFLLCLVGGQMIVNARKEEAEGRSVAFLKWPLLVSLALATSIDAFAVGLSLSFIDQEILLPVLVIGCVTFLLSWVGCYLGAKVGCLSCGQRMEALAGVVLIGLGGKILLEHTWF